MTKGAPPRCRMSGLSHSYCPKDEPVTTTPTKYSAGSKPTIWPKAVTVAALPKATKTSSVSTIIFDDDADDDADDDVPVISLIPRSKKKVSSTSATPSTPLSPVSNRTSITSGIETDPDEDLDVQEEESEKTTTGSEKSGKDLEAENNEFAEGNIDDSTDSESEPTPTVLVNQSIGTSIFKLSDQEIGYVGQVVASIGKGFKEVGIAEKAAEEVDLNIMSEIETDVNNIVSSTMPSSLDTTVIHPSAIDPLAEISLDDLVDNLDSYMDEYLQTPALTSPLFETSSNDQFKIIRDHLTEILQLDAHSLFLSDNSRLAADFAEKLMSDPLLTDNERSKLTIILDLPSLSTQWSQLVLTETEATKFIVSMEQSRKDAQGLKIEHLKCKEEGQILKEELNTLQTERCSIEAEIALLQARLSDNEKMFAAKQKALVVTEDYVHVTGSALRDIVSGLAKNQSNIRLQKTKKMSTNFAKKSLLETVKPLENFHF